MGKNKWYGIYQQDKNIYIHYTNDKKVAKQYTREGFNVEVIKNKKNFGDYCRRPKGIK